MSDYPFKKNDHVVYGSGGVCLVEDVGSLRFGSLTQDYYTLRPIEETGSVIYVPCGNQELTAKLRFVLTEEQIKNTLRAHLSSPMEWQNDRKLRSAQFRAVLSSGDPIALLSMIRCLLLKKIEFEKNNRKLSLSDMEILTNASYAISTEIAFSLGISKAEVTEYIRRILDTDAID